jgi:hypothetical protein
MNTSLRIHRRISARLTDSCAGLWGVSETVVI